MKFATALGVACLFGIAIESIGNSAEEENRPRSVKPFVIISGADSHVAKPSLELARSPEEWNRVWAAHLGTSTDDAYRPAMEVDFDRCMVAAIFAGARTNVRGIRIDSISEIDDSVRIRFHALGYQTEGIRNIKPADRPYALLVLAKSPKRIVIEHNVQQYKGHTPEWKRWPEN